MKPRAARFVLLGILLLAVALRFYRIDAQSLWNDEGNSARIAERSVDLILEGAEGDIHPPGYYLLLHGWRAVFGQSEFALRSLSAVAGTGLVLLTFLLGRRAFSSAAGLGAALLAGIAPLGIYYSQEARMYALLGLLAAASTYLLLQILGGQVDQPAGSRSQPAPRSRLGATAAYSIAAVAGIYVQYAFALVLLAHNAILCVWWVWDGRRSRNRWRWLATWVGAQAVILLLYLPWVSIALQSVGGWSSAGRAYSLGRALTDSLTVLFVGVTVQAEESVFALAGFALLLLVGFAHHRADRLGWIGAATAGLGLAIPIALVLALDLYKPAWRKFLIIALPSAHLLIAHGVENVARWVAQLIPARRRRAEPAIRLAAYVVLSVATVPSLLNLYTDPAYARDDYRKIAADIKAEVRDSDGIVLSAPNQWEVFTYYYPDRDVYPAPYRPGEDEIKGFLRPLLDGYDRLFVLYWGDDESDPEHHVEAGLAAEAYKAGDSWYGRVRVSTYALAPLPDQPTSGVDAEFGDAIRLMGSAVAATSYEPGEILPVTLFWQPEIAMSERYKVTIQLLDGAGQLSAQHDSEPGAGLWPTTVWEPEQRVVDRHGVSIPGSLSAGQYTLIVAVYEPASGARLPVSVAGASVGDYLTLGLVEVAPE